MKTKVRFVIFEGEVLAVFIGRDACRRASFQGQWVRTCYAHIGQHSECYDGMEKRKRATVKQYFPLKREMERIGYALEVMR